MRRDAVMGKRVEWLKFVMRYSRPRSRAPQILIFLAFEFYYGLCKLRGYRARHFLDPVPAERKGTKPGDRYILIWPPLPLSIRLLDRIFCRAGHVEVAPYTPEAFEEVRASGRRAEIMVTQQGEFRAGNST
jgi:hypothetical protein